MELSGDSARRRGRASLARKAEELMRRERLFEADSRVLVMLSGGQDSLALLHVLRGRRGLRWGPRFLHALHVNHHLRGAESDADEALVVRSCAALGVELTVAHRTVQKRLGNVQEAAREARRTEALAVAAQEGCDRIALGHTADDQAETLLYRTGRYGGLAALAGMRPLDLPWVRPLLGCRREETAAYCRQQGLEFSVDRGNAYPGYARTGIREKVLPAWEAALPGAVGAACRTAEVATEAGEAIAAVLEQARAAVEAPWAWADSATADRCHDLSAAALLTLPVPIRRLLLHEWLEERARPAASRASVLAVEALLDVQGSAERSIKGGWRVLKEYDQLSLTRGRCEVSEAIPALKLPVPGRVTWGGLVVSAEAVDCFGAPDVATEAFVDADALLGDLRVRGPREGDRVRPLGAPGTRKLKDVLVDRRVPARERARRPLVVCDERIIWVCGLLIAEEAKITGDSKQLVRLSIAPSPRARVVQAQDRAR